MQTQQSLSKATRMPTVPIWAIIKGTELHLREGDYVDVMEPELMVEKGFMKNTADVKKFLAENNIDTDYSPFEIYELSNFKGENFVMFYANGVKCTISAKYFTTNYRVPD